MRLTDRLLQVTGDSAGPQHTRPASSFAFLKSSLPCSSSSTAAGLAEGLQGEIHIKESDLLLHREMSLQQVAKW